MRNWRRNPAVVWEDDGEVIWAVHPSYGGVVSLTGPGPLIWELLGEGSMDNLVAEFTKASGEQSDIIKRDILAYLQELEELRLVTRG
ncbi:MAG: PqqD family protein [Propionibacteriaceae bacterium]|nr:PqqD family protein [Propionibacteriaceae bacterium]